MPTRKLKTNEMVHAGHLAKIYDGPFGTAVVLRVAYDGSLTLGRMYGFTRNGLLAVTTEDIKTISGKALEWYTDTNGELIHADRFEPRHAASELAAADSDPAPKAALRYWVVYMIQNSALSSEYHVAYVSVSAETAEAAADAYRNGSVTRNATGRVLYVVESNDRHPYKKYQCTLAAYAVSYKYTDLGRASTDYITVEATNAESAKEQAKAIFHFNEDVEPLSAEPCTKTIWVVTYTMPAADFATHLVLRIRTPWAVCAVECVRQLHEGARILSCCRITKP
jgi:hypothetical protein